MKKETIKVRVEESEKEQLVEIASILDIPSSQIIREAIREKIADLKTTHPRIIQVQSEILLAK